MRKTITTVAVLALAATATPARAETAEDRYWHSSTLFTMTHPRQVGTAPNTYWVVQRRITESTAALNGEHWTGFLELGVKPKSAADLAAWKRDGSPTSWQYRTEGMLIELSTKPGKARLVPSKPSGWILGGRKTTYQELQALPSEPAALKEWLVQAVLAGNDPPLRENIRLSGECERLLHEMPVSKKVREAAFTLLASEPGFKVSDAGKNRKRLTLTDKADKYLAKHGYVVDTSSMLLVGRTLDTWMDGKPFPNKTWTMVIESGWKNSAPTAPRPE
jgi:hypothetical protein